MIRSSDCANAAVTLAWELSPDLVPDEARRRVRAGILLVGAGLLAWFERNELTAAVDGVQRTHDLRERLRAASTQAEVEAVVAEIEGPAQDQPSPVALTAAAVATVGTIALEVALRRRLKRRIAAGERFPRLPGALARGALALSLGPLTRAMEEYDATSRRSASPV